jgi:hypothetical protein
MNHSKLIKLIAWRLRWLADLSNEEEGVPTDSVGVEEKKPGPGAKVRNIRDGRPKEDSGPGSENPTESHE